MREKEAWELVRLMPTWGKARGYGKGRGQASFDFNYRVTTYSMIANGTPLSAIGPNIIAVVNRTAPWLKPEAPSAPVLTPIGSPSRVHASSCAWSRRRSPPPWSMVLS